MTETSKPIEGKVNKFNLDELRTSPKGYVDRIIKTLSSGRGGQDSIRALYELAKNGTPIESQTRLAQLQHYALVDENGQITESLAEREENLETRDLIIRAVEQNGFT